jgi:hypothetical protein
MSIFGTLFMEITLHDQKQNNQILKESKYTWNQIKNN